MKNYFIHATGCFKDLGMGEKVLLIGTSSASLVTGNNALGSPILWTPLRRGTESLAIQLSATGRQTLLRGIPVKWCVWISVCKVSGDKAYLPTLKISSRRNPTICADGRGRLTRLPNLKSKKVKLGCQLVWVKPCDELSGHLGGYCWLRISERVTLDWFYRDIQLRDTW